MQVEMIEYQLNTKNKGQRVQGDRMLANRILSGCFYHYPGVPSSANDRIRVLQISVGIIIF